MFLNMGTLRRAGQSDTAFSSIRRPWQAGPRILLNRRDGAFYMEGDFLPSLGD